jgi:hypothetical protein
MRRNVRKYLRRHLLRGARQAVKPPWYRRYRFHILVVLFLGFALLYCGLYAPFSQTGLMECQYNAIHDGMSVEEIEDLLGKPSFSDLDDQKIWGGRGGVIVVHFNGRCVSGKEFTPIQQPFPWPNRR